MKQSLTVSLFLVFSSCALFSQTSYNVYFGDLHSHSWYSDGNQDQNINTYTKPVARAMTYARSSPSMNFLGVSDHNHNESLRMTLPYWRAGNSEADSMNQDGVFVSLYGQEWGTIGGGGHLLIYGTDKLYGWNPGVYDVYVAKNNHAMLFDSLKKYNGFAYLAHPDQSDYSGLFSNPYNAAWDSIISGVALKNGPSTSTNTSEGNPSGSDYTSRYHDLLRLGYHVAPCANQDNHNTTFGRVNQQRTAVLSPSLSKSDIVYALRNRRAYATEDHNLQLRLTVDSHQMGEIFNALSTFTLRVTSLDPDNEHLSRIEIRYGVPGSGSAPTVLTSSNGNDSLITSRTQTLGSTYYYYAYVMQTDGQEAWSAPVWVTAVNAIGPTAVLPELPADNEVNQPLSPTMRWSKSPSASTYRLQVSTDSLFNTGIAFDDAAIVDTQKQVSGLSNYTTYFWRVRAQNSGGSSAYSAAWKFRTMPTSATYYILASAGSNGSVTPAGNVSVTAGSNQSFAITPNTGYHIDDVLIDGVSVGQVSSYTFVTVLDSHTIASSFAINTYALQTTASNGSVARSPDQSLYSHGSVVELTAVGETGYHFDHWEGDISETDSALNPLEYEMTSDADIAAVFALNQYVISAASGSNGSIVPSGNITALHGETVSFGAEPDEGYHFAGFIVDGDTMPPAPEYLFTGIDSSHSISAIFAINMYVVSASSGLNGNISPSGNVTVPHGGTQTFSIVPDSGFRIDEVRVNGVNVGALSEYTFDDVVSEQSIVATFEDANVPLIHTVMAEAYGNGAIIPSGASQVGDSQTIEFSIRPDRGYEIDSLIVDGVARPVSSSFILENVRVDHHIRVTFRTSVTPLSMMAGWNLVSLPIIPVGETREDIFPSASSDAYGFTMDGGYQSLSVLGGRYGFWIKFAAPETVSLLGLRMERDSIAVSEGWNIIGTVMGNVPVDGIVALPEGLVRSQFFEYDGRYIAVEQLKPGKAYWVKTDRAGTFIIGSAGTQSAAGQRSTE